MIAASLRSLQSLTRNYLNYSTLQEAKRRSNLILIKQRINIQKHGIQFKKQKLSETA